ncbi:MAG: ribonuclease P protein component [Rhodobacteraceae bacterium]|nr:MAG: ribonuclease P protein component [Paracoccaceae bacterium]
MTPPEAPETGTDATPGSPVPAVLSCPGLRVLSKRRQFLAAARARRQGTAGFLLQARDRRDDDPAIGVGFTCSKKVGNAVARNRAKRRLREIARLELPDLGRPGWDYVLIGKAGETAARDFADLRGDLRHALRKVHGPER